MTNNQIHDIALEIAKLYVSTNINEYKDTDGEDMIINDFIQVYKDVIEKLNKN